MQGSCAQKRYESGFLTFVYPVQGQRVVTTTRLITLGVIDFSTTMLVWLETESPRLEEL